MHYTKPALSFADQVKTLASRNLVIDDATAAEETLSQISYYRLSAYFRPFRETGGEGLNGANFRDIEVLYRFDGQLRKVVLEALEPIEVYFRTRITYKLAMRKGPFAHLDPSLFQPFFDHAKFVNDIKELEVRSSDQFVSHFHARYDEENDLPIWMATELMSFGFLSRIYQELALDIKKDIAIDFGVHHSVLKSWLHSLA